MEILHLSVENIAFLVRLAREGYPNEVCGLIGGQWRREHAVGEMILPVPNAAPEPTVTFDMDRRAMVEAILAVERKQREIVAIYHSHPVSSAKPSHTDIRLATWPDAIYVIVGQVQQNPPEITAWIIRHGEVAPAKLAIGADAP